MLLSYVHVGCHVVSLSIYIYIVNITKPLNGLEDDAYLEDLINTTFFLRYYFHAYKKSKHVVYMHVSTMII